jgi:hypothetical protein
MFYQIADIHQLAILYTKQQRTRENYKLIAKVYTHPSSISFVPLHDPHNMQQL